MGGEEGRVALRRSNHPLVVGMQRERHLALPYGVRRRPGGAIWFGLGVTVGDAAN